MFTHNITVGWTKGSEIITKAIARSAGADYEIDESVPNAVDTLVACALDVSQVKALFIVADGALVLETNSGSSAANTITLVANEPFVWTSGGAALRDTAGAAITVDITALYVTNATGAAVILKLRALVDPTV